MNPSDPAEKSVHLPNIVIVPDTFDATDGAETPFGKRSGGDVFRLTIEHIAALQAGQTLALDVMNEYVVFLKTNSSGENSKDKVPGYGE
jgi:hypothetical protein